MSKTLKAIKEARDFTPCCHKAENVIGNIMVVTKENYDLQKELYDKAIKQFQQDFKKQIEERIDKYNREIRDYTLYEHHRYAKRQIIKELKYVLTLLGDNNE